MRALEAFLPSPPCAILDDGGGPGCHTIELAQRGYSVTLLHISGESLRLAEDKTRDADVSRD